MTRKQFATALEQLDISKNGASALLGIPRSSVYRYLNGSSEVPEVVEKLIEMYLRHGVPE